MGSETIKRLASKHVYSAPQTNHRLETTVTALRLKRVAPTIFGAAHSAHIKRWFCAVIPSQELTRASMRQTHGCLKR